MLVDAPLLPATYLNLHLMLLPCLSQLFLHLLQPPLQPSLVAPQLLQAAGCASCSSGSCCGCF
jgi:hypothetical protein